jgi:hypothetical protein
MCECHARIDEKLKPLNGKLATGFSTFSDRFGPTGLVLTLLLQVEKINSRGKKPPHVLPTFCPFCGVKIEVGKQEVMKAPEDADAIRKSFEREYTGPRW